MRLIIVAFLVLSSGCLAEAPIEDMTEPVTGEAGQELGYEWMCSLICNDGNDCTVDSCGPTGGCVHSPRAQGDPCVDEERECQGACFAPYTVGGITHAGKCGCTGPL